MNEKDFEKEDISSEDNHFLDFFQKNDIKDIFIFSEILNNPNFYS